jgi:capsular polysaccharide transport system permease protein
VITESNITIDGPQKSPKPSERSPWQVSKAVWFALILRELQVLLWSRRFGAFWMLAEPIAFIAVMMLMRGYLMHQSMPGVPFALWLLVGIVPFSMMNGIAINLMGAVTSNQALFSYRQVKPFDTFVARTAVQIMVSTAVYVLIAFFMVYFLSYAIPIYQPIQMIATLTVMVVFAFSLGVFLCLLLRALPDIAPIVRLMFLPLMILSGVIFPLRFIPQPYYDWLLWNPFLHLIDMFRQYSMQTYTPLPGVSLEYPAKCAFIGLFVAVLIYRRRQYDLVTS